MPHVFDAVQTTNPRKRIKIVTARKIQARYPTWKQANLMARAAELQEKRLDGGTLTSGELAEKAEIEAVWAWIKATRLHSDTLETQQLAGSLPVDWEKSDWPA